jgi:hypothetical protein
MLVRLVKENYFFHCLSCRTMGNLPGVLAHLIDVNSELSQKEKTEELRRVQKTFPYPPKNQAPPVVPYRRG